MSLIHRHEEIPADVVALECHACQRRHTIDEIMVIGGGDIRCLDCGTGGLIARKPRVADRFPPELRNEKGELELGFVATPIALLEHRAALGLSAHEMIVIVALERHRRALGGEVWSFRDALADQTGLSVDQVKRATSRLCAAGLLRQRQAGSIRGDRGRGPNFYDLSPLWDRLALECTSAPQTSGIAGASAPQTDLRALDTPFAGAHDPICGAPVHHEVESSRCPAVDPVGASPADVAASTPDPEPGDAEIVDDDDDAEIWRAFEAWRTEHPRTTNVQDAWRRFTAEQNGSNEINSSEETAA